MVPLAPTVTYLVVVASWLAVASEVEVASWVVVASEVEGAPRVALAPEVGIGVAVNVGSFEVVAIDPAAASKDGIST